MVVSHTLIPWLSFCLLGLSIIALFFFLFEVYNFFDFLTVINKYFDLKEIVETL